MGLQSVFPPIYERVLSNGLRLIAVADRSRDGVVVAFQMPFGRYNDPQGMEGLTDLTAGLVIKGPKEISSEKFSEEFEYRGASVSASVGEEHTTFMCRTISRFFFNLFPLFWETVSSPALDEKEFARLKKEALTSLQAESVDPSFLVTRHFFSQLAGHNHPAGRFQKERSLNCLKAEQVKQFHADTFSPAEAVLVVAGDFDPASFHQEFQGMLSVWNPQPKQQPVVAQAVKTETPLVRFIDKPDLSQTTIMMGQPFAGEKNPHRNALAVANYILGAGNFSSRLMAKIRSRYGHTYGISSHISSEREFGVFYINTFTQNDNVGEVVASVLEEYRNFCAFGVTSDELEKAKKFAIGNLSFQLEGIGNVVEKLLWLRLYGRENSFIEQFDKAINALELDEVNQLIKEYFQPELPVMVFAGKKKQVLSNISGLGYPVKSFSYRDSI